MGRMVDGRWVDDETLGAYKDGRFERAETSLRSWVTTDGAAGPSGVAGFAAESGRYHLFVALNCPWAHRTLLARLLNGLTDHVSLSVAAPARTVDGWVFDAEGRFADPVLGSSALHEVYAAGADAYSGRVTVPVLWDKNSGQIVSNESAEIVRMLNDAFGSVAPGSPDFYPPSLRAEIDEVNERVYREVNNGVYRAGFARTQAAYDEAFDTLFAALLAVMTYRPIIALQRIWRDPLVEWTNRLMTGAYAKRFERICKSHVAFLTPEPPVHRETEWAFDYADAERLLTEYRALILGMGYSYSFLQEIRVTKADPFWASPSYGRDSLWLSHYNMDRDDRWMAQRTRFEE